MSRINSTEHKRNLQCPVCESENFFVHLKRGLVPQLICFKCGGNMIGVGYRAININDEHLSKPQDENNHVIDEPIQTSWLLLREIVLRRDNFQCQCKCESNFCLTSSNLEVHHIIPRSQGGLDVLSNLIALCEYCHDKIQ